MLEKRTVSQCISSDYCEGWNDAVEEANKTIRQKDAKIAILSFNEAEMSIKYNALLRTIKKLTEETGQDTERRDT